jgi:hypothetical protein
MHFRRSLSFVSLGFEWAISDLVLGQSLDGGRPPHVAARVEFLVPALDHTPRLSDCGLGFGSASPSRQHLGKACAGAHRSMVADSPDVRKRVRTPVCPGRNSSKYLCIQSVAIPERP